MRPGRQPPGDLEPIRKLLEQNPKTVFVPTELYIALALLGEVTELIDTVMERLAALRAKSKTHKYTLEELTIIFFKNEAALEKESLYYQIWRSYEPFIKRTTQMSLTVLSSYLENVRLGVSVIFQTVKPAHWEPFLDYIYSGKLGTFEQVCPFIFTCDECHLTDFVLVEIKNKNCKVGFY